MLWSLHGGSKYLTHHHRETTTSSSLQFQPTSNSGIASCNVHHLLLSKQNLLSEHFSSQERYPYHVSSPMASLMVKSSFSSENHEEPNQIVSCQCSRYWPDLHSLLTCLGSLAPVITILDLSTQRKVSIAAQHSVLPKKTHCTGFQLHFQLLKALLWKSALHLTGQMWKWRNNDFFAN